MRIGIAAALVASILIGAMAYAYAQGGSDLPRRHGAVSESYEGVDVSYTHVTDPDGRRIRMIVTRPRTASGRLPTVFVAGWLSCDSVEAPPGTRDSTGLVFQALAQTPGFAVVRVDKPGVGDSEGDCAATDFNEELAAYRAAFRAMRSWSFVDADRIFVFGISNGGGWAPLVAEGAPVAGYISAGGWTGTWFDHMLGIERRRQVLAGRNPNQVDDLAALSERLYRQFLLEGRHPSAILADDPTLHAVWDGDPDHLYGRPVVYYQQLQQLDLAGAWSNVAVPTLVLWGEYDWIMSQEESSSIAALVNARASGLARFVELPNAGHTFENYASLEASFNGRSGAFDRTIATLITSWLREQVGVAPQRGNLQPSQGRASARACKDK